MRVLDKELDDILVMEFENNNSGFTFVVFCCYLPPEETQWGVETQQIYIYQEAECIFLCGDLNGCIVNQPDFVQEIDDLGECTVLDKVTAGHGEAIIDLFCQRHQSCHC